MNKEILMMQSGFEQSDENQKGIYNHKNLIEVTVDIRNCNTEEELNSKFAEALVQYGMNLQKKRHHHFDGNKEIVLQSKKKRINLTQKEVEHVVNEWYLNGMYPDILQDEFGNDLEEILDVDYSVLIETIN